LDEQKAVTQIRAKIVIAFFIEVPCLSRWFAVIPFTPFHGTQKQQIKDTKSAKNEFEAGLGASQQGFIIRMRIKSIERIAVSNPLLFSCIQQNVTGNSMAEDQSLPDRDEIVESLRSGREEALAEYFSAVQGRLKRIVNFRLDYRLSGRVSESDVIQETYVRAAKRIDSFLEKDDMPFFVWLRLEISQKLHEIHRHHFGAEKRDVRKEIKLGQNNDSGKTSMALAAHIVAQLTSPSRLIERAEQIAILEKTLAEMNELDREVIALRHFEELSNIETARILEIEPAAASKRYLRALKRLREIMESAKGLYGN
jgi:RNA polymerase sigma-70 factor (ECF subfamily)